jgi:prepilin-type N-terminal cleavage/methylation domain-containing protein
MYRCSTPRINPSVSRRPSGFTLIELLTVIAIISLLIAILIPALSKARDAAKNVKTRGIMKSLGDGLEMFKTENEEECHGSNYPSSKAGDDPTEVGDYDGSFGSEQIFGAQWLVRYLMGKNLDGYVAKRNVPKVFDALSPPAGWSQELWYGKPGDPDWPSELTQPLPRSGPYVNDAIVRPPRDLPGSPVDDSTGTDPKWVNWVFVDAYNTPILYYAAHSKYSEAANVTLSTWTDDPDYPGVFEWHDNALFTGMTNEDNPNGEGIPPWDFGGGKHKLTFGPSAWESDPVAQHDQIKDHTLSFAYFIMNKQAFGTTFALHGVSAATVAPQHRDSFLLWSPGKDGQFGTGDDVMNFQ